MSSRYQWTVVILIAVIVLIIGRGACGVGKKEAKKKSSDGEVFKKTSLAPVPVTAFVVVSRDVPLVINAEGKTEATDRYQAKAPADIKVQKILVEEGDRVQPGDGLVKFDNEKAKLKLNFARAEIREAEAELADANYQDNNRDQLLDEGKISEIELGGLEERISLNQAKLERAKAEVDLHEGATDQGQLNSPIAGIVTKRHASEGSDMAEGEVLVEVVKLDPIYFTFNVPVDSVTAIEKGAEVAAKFPSLGEQEFSGEIAVIGSGVDDEEALPMSGGAGVPVKLKIANADQALKADMRGNVVIRTQGKRKIFPVPETALVRGDRSVYIYRVDGNKAKKVAVELGDPSNGQPTIIKGLSVGDTIVALSEEDLRDGAIIEIQATRAAEK